jgi:hypothetical protein
VCLAGSLNRNVREFSRLHADELELVEASRLDTSAIRRCAAALGRSANGLLMLSLPAGTSTIELLFGPDLWDVVGTTLTALALAVLAGLVWRRRRGTQGRSVAEDAGKLDVSRS